MANAYADQAVQSIYNSLYGPGLHSDLWFNWKGKPLVLAPLDGMVVNGRTINHSQEVSDFFNMRYSWTWMNIEDPDVWKWMDFYPQQYGWHESSSIPEQLSVSAGMVPHGSGVGRSYQNGSQPPDDEYDLTGSEGQGDFFAEQWSRLDTIDPEFLLLTGWNEWVAQRQVSTGSGGPTHFTGDPLEAGDTWFIDAYNQEYSRDIEPMQGGHTDNYYYQMIDGIRHFKGVRQQQPPAISRTLSIDGDFADWNSVTSEFRDTVGDTAHRDWDGWGGLHYTNTTGRNDIITAKVANDASNVYFYVETNENITRHTGQNWMMLFIDSDLDDQTGWNGYNYAVNMDVVNSAFTTLKRTTDGVNWETIAFLDYKVTGNMMEIEIPRDIIDASGDVVSFHFHWADNIQELNDISQFFINGDSVPNRRFDYNYQSVAIPLDNSPIPGDANLDGNVDVFELAILAMNYGASDDFTWSDGDFTGEGVVDVSDLGILATDFGNTAAVAAQTAPEPGALTLLRSPGWRCCAWVPDDGSNSPRSKMTRAPSVSPVRLCRW